MSRSGLLRPSARLIPLLVVLAGLAGPIGAQRANYKLAAKYSSERLRPFLYSTSVRPSWIGKTDRFHYSYRTSAGTRYWLVDPEARTRKPLFDHDQLAAELSTAVKKPFDAEDLRLSSLSVDDKVAVLKFVAEGRRFEFELKTGKLSDKGAARRGSSRSGRGGSLRGLSREQMMQRFQELRRRRGNREEQQRLIQEMMRRQGQGQRSSSSRSGRSSRTSHRALSPDGSVYVYAQNHNLYYVEGKLAPPKKATATKAKAKAPEKAEAKTDGKKTKVVVKTGEVAQIKVEEGKKAKDDKAKPEKKKPTYVFDEKKAVQLTKDGAEDYSFASRSRFRGRSRSRTSTSSAGTSSSNRKTRPSVSWSKDSKSFYVSRRDYRGVKELFLVDSIAQPRPSLRSYKYPMPGEEKARAAELYVFDRSKKKLHRIQPKWKDESYSNVHWHGDGHELRFLRRDRLQRNAQMCTVDPVAATGNLLLTESVRDANLNTQSMRYLEKRKAMIWWSERTGWGHFYLYGIDGTLKNAITKGNYRASRIVAVDEEQGQMWFRANGREKNENLYYEHLYRVKLDGSGLVCLDPGNASHRSTLSPTKRFLVDNYSRVDLEPHSVVRDASGKQIMELEVTDLSKLRETGWKMPETFVVKAADGVTDLYGNMWKPFDFRAGRRYPIIANVYPGPQQEGVSHGFSASNSRQQLAQLGFIVIQVGHRGGTPARSKRYSSYGYGNLRDYGLEDKKRAIEQLADRCKFIDIERVGIYGHSGGGFMTGAALMQKPYNEFFKVGVASAGNHDNNIYNSNWSEKYHGLKEVTVEEKKKTTGSTQTENRGRRRVRRSLTADAWQGKQTGGQKGKTQEKKTTETKKQDTKGQDKKGQEKTDTKKKDDKKKDDKKTEKKTKFEIKVPTNAELAANLKGHLLLVHGEVDNNVHPANTMRLVDALIKANKRFDLLIIPGAAHGFGRARTYFTHRMWEYFAEHLLGDRLGGADILEKKKR